MKFVIVILLLITFSLYSDTLDVTHTSDVSVIEDTTGGTIQNNAEGIHGDTVGASSTSMAPDVPDSLMKTVPVTPPAPEPKKGVKKIKLIKREYPYRKNRLLAIGMMVFAAVMMASAQNWNPK